MKNANLPYDSWKDATFDGVERMQFLQTEKMSMPERLAALDNMLNIATAIKEASLRVAEVPPPYGSDSE